MTNQHDDDLPRIMLDEEDRRGYQNKSKPSGATKAGAPSPQTPAPSSGGGKGLTVFALLIALAASGGAGYLFMQLEQQKIAAQSAEQRIADLENRLSATGEDLGESTVALQVKVSELSNRAEELWEQMDKLWASAWRRNQKEIGELDTKVDEQVDSLKQTTTRLSSSSQQTLQQMQALSAQVDNVASELLSLNVQMERSAATSGETQRDLNSATEKLRLLEQRNAALLTRVNQLETEIRSLATRMASAGTTP